MKALGWLYIIKGRRWLKMFISRKRYEKDKHEGLELRERHTIIDILRKYWELKIDLDNVGCSEDGVLFYFHKKNGNYVVANGEIKKTNLYEIKSVDKSVITGDITKGELINIMLELEENKAHIKTKIERIKNNEK